ncbi:MAG TPA: TetR/AcrR family transcriptional regulator [Solirubrobacterales bacterium]
MAEGSAGKGPDGLKGTWRLPRGTQKISGDEVAHIQRLRLVAGVARALTEHGYASLSVEQVVEQAGVSRSTFYENFKNKHDCVFAAHEVIFDCLAAEVAEACAAVPDWPAKVSAAVVTSLTFVVDAPDEARLLSLDVVGADPGVARRVLASNERLAGMLRAGRRHYPDAERLPELTELALIGAVSSLLNGLFIDDRADRIEELKPQVVQLLLMPYVGAEEAQRLSLAA